MSRNLFSRQRDPCFWVPPPGWLRRFIDSYACIVLDRALLSLQLCANRGSVLPLITHSERLALSYPNSSLHIPAEVTAGWDWEIMVLNRQKSPALVPKAFSDCLSLEICEFLFRRLCSGYRGAPPSCQSSSRSLSRNVAHSDAAELNRCHFKVMAQKAISNPLSHYFQG